MTSTADVYDVIAKTDPTTNAPLLGDARLMLGDGTFLELEGGRAECTAAQAEQLATRGDVYVVPRSQQPPTVPAEQAITPPPIADTKPADASQPDQPADLTPEQQAAIDAAREHLQEEGEDVPEPATTDSGGDPGDEDGAGAEASTAPASALVIPDGFDVKTGEGEDRCLGRKGDGQQCSNAAKGDTHACGLHKHQVAELATPNG